MPAEKLEISWKLDNKSEIFQFVKWYEDYYTTTSKDPSGKDRSRKGNAKKFLKEYLEEHIRKRFSTFKNDVPQEGNVLDGTAEIFTKYQESKRLPLDVVATIKNLPEEDGKKYLDLWKKAQRTG